MKKNNESLNIGAQIGPSFLSLLCILFITLKLIGIISWSWWWVLSPIYIPIVVVLFCVSLVAFLSRWE